jgi:hypothetical protein
MKMLFFLILLCGTSVKAATPRVGDWVEYKTTITDKRGRTISSYSGTEILRVDSMSNYLVRWTEDFGVHEAWVARTDLFYIEDIVAFCKQQDRWPTRRMTLETLELPIGQFETCRVEGPKSIHWFSDRVPFGWIKERLNHADSSFAEQQIIRMGL